MAEVVVELTTGFVRGVIENHEEGFDYYAFKGIPYAEPPIGELRFQDPRLKEKWTGTLDCTNFGPECLQHNLFTNTSSYSEDCLHLNVYTHSIDNANANYPVIVVIHGGGFLFGSGNDEFFGPEYLIRKNVVLVIVNYRIGVLGFLNLQDHVAPGNQGLKDMVMALQWIQKNIHTFCGNPNNVTVHGAGAGGVASHYLAVSPATKGLMHKVICQGGTIYSGWADSGNPKENAIKLCSLLGRELTDSREIVEFLRSVDAKKLLDAQLQLFTQLDTTHFGPAKNSESSNPSMPIDEFTTADRCIDLPCLMGYTAEEGLIIMIGEFFFPDKSKQEFFQMCDEDFGTFTKLYNVKGFLTRYNLTDTQFRRLYFKRENISEKNQDKFVELTSDVFFFDCLHRLARVQAEKSSAPTYLYKFSYDHPDAIVKYFLKDSIPGAGHFADQPFLFKMRVFEKMGVEHFKKGSREYKLMEQMTEMWANFATYGRPTVETSNLIPVRWQPIADGTLLRYLNIDEDITMQYTVNVDRKFLSAKNIIV